MATLFLVAWGIVAFAVGAWFGLKLPDVDQRTDLLQHRSIITHGPLVPLVLFLVLGTSSEPGSACCQCQCVLASWSTWHLTFSRGRGQDMLLSAYPFTVGCPAGPPSCGFLEACLCVLTGQSGWSVERWSHWCWRSDLRESSSTLSVVRVRFLALSRSLLGPW